VQPEKQNIPMTSMLDGRKMDDKELQSAKAPMPSTLSPECPSCIIDPNVTVTRLVHREKHFSSSFVTLEGMKMDDKELQPSKALCPSTLSLDSASYVTVRSPVQSEKQCSPMISKLDGRQMDVSPKHVENA
jgi:hypothetical protein